MLAQHREAFFQTAQKFTCWIALREPNALAERWIGRNCYRPKSEHCKAKTADNSAHRFGGLVVNPLLVPEAFLLQSRPDAVTKWKQFLASAPASQGFSWAETGLEKGIVRQKGGAIFADYDLMTIIKSNQAGDYLFTTNADELVLMRLVIPEINRRIGLDMIQHGPEFDPGFNGLGAREREFVLYFGPGNRFQTGLSSMPKSGH